MRARPTTHRLTAALAAVALSLLAGCAGNTTPDGKQPTSAATRLIKPGDELHFGRPAKVSLGKDVGEVEVTITGIRRGDSADLKKLKYQHASRYTPYYVNYEMRPISGHLANIGFILNIDASGPGGDAQLIVVAPGAFPPCENRGFSPMGAKPGEIVRSCTLFLTKKGDPPIDTLRFRLNGS